MTSSQTDTASATWRGKPSRLASAATGSRWISRRSRSLTGPRELNAAARGGESVVIHQYCVPLTGSATWPLTLLLAARGLGRGAILCRISGEERDLSVGFKHGEPHIREVLDALLARSGEEVGK